MFLWLLYFSPKSFGFSCIRLLVCFLVISSQLLIKLSFNVLEFPVLSVLLYPLSISLQSSFFRQYILGFFLKLYSYFFPVLPFPFRFHISQRLSFVLSFWPFFFRRFFICVSSRISHSGFDIFSCFLRGCQFSHKLISFLHRLVNLSRLYNSLICKVVLDLFYSFLSKCSPFDVS